MPMHNVFLYNGKTNSLYNFYQFVMSATILAVGLGLIFSAQNFFTVPGYDIIRDILPKEVWGSLAITVGFAGVVATTRRTVPFIVIQGLSWCRAGIYLVWVIGYIRLGGAGLGIIFYLQMFVLNAYPFKRDYKENIRRYLDKALGTETSSEI